MAACSTRHLCQQGTPPGYSTPAHAISGKQTFPGPRTCDSGKASPATAKQSSRPAFCGKSWIG